MLIDTYKAVNDLKEAGAEERLAEAIVRNISRADEQVATKEHVSQEIGLLQTELKGEIDTLRTELKGEIDTLRTELKGEIDTLRETLRKEMREETRKVYRAVGAATAFVSLLMTVFEFIG